MGADEVVSSQSFQVSSSTVQNDLLDRGRKEESIKIKAHSENAANYSLRPFICSEKISTSNVLPEGASLERQGVIHRFPHCFVPAHPLPIYNNAPAPYVRIKYKT